MFFRRRAPVQCFFCNQTLSSRPRNINTFKCPHCDCWNRYNSNGEIVSDEPAMHEEALNVASFSKRASPQKDRMLSAYNKSLFCRTCQTNQTLYINLLSNYLPDEKDPTYQSLLSQLPDYQASLDARYPTVCEDCIGGVEEEIRKSERRARADALGGWLRDGQQYSSPKRTDRAPPPRTGSSKDIFVWWIRGSLWVLNIVVSIGLSSLAISPLRPNISVPPPLIYGLPILCLISVFWTFWDPTWLTRHRAMIKATELRVIGRKAWINFQMGAWISRLVTSFLLVFDCVPHWWPWFIIVLELSLLILSSYVIKVVYPPSVRLMQSGPKPPAPYATTMIPKPSSTSKASLPPQPDDLFSSLSLSSGPTISRSHSNPIFGQTSPLRSAPSFGGTGSNPQEVMDWTPSPSVPLDPASRDSESSWLRPQRFFPPSEPTGLEGLLEKTNLLDPGDQEKWPHLRQGNGRRPMDKKNDPMTTYLVALLVAVLMGSALLLRTGSWRLLQGGYASTKSQNYSPGQNAWHHAFNS